MAEIARDQAVQNLAQELAPMGPDDLAEVYNELFPGQPATEDQARRDRNRLLDQITDHFRRGLEAEEIVALWHVVFPRDLNVYFDEETNMVHCNKEGEPVEFAE
jgi:hypothetical protein